MPAPRSTARYGWRPDMPDHRDRIYNLEASVLRTTQLPPVVKPLTNLYGVPRWNQLQLGSCTGHGIARVLAYAALKQGEGLKLQPGWMANNTPGLAGLSRLFIYYGERAIEGTIPYDSGAQIRDGIKVIANEGAPVEADWPYDPSAFAERPPASAFANAKLHKAIQYQRIIPDGPGAPIHTALANEQPVVFGFSVPSYFEDGTWNPSTGEPLPLPGPDVQWIGGHCVVLTGYDMKENTFDVDNSWGEDWGLAGRFKMDARWVDPWRGCASDFWCVSRVV